MEREIKYMAKRKSDGVWIYGVPTECANGRCYMILGETEGSTDDNVNFFYSEIDKDTIREYIGLHDAGGRDIFEDDIIAVGGDKPISLVRHVIMWHKESASFIAVSGGYRGFPITQEWIDRNNIVVVGNAIDNRNMAEEALGE